MSRKTITLSTIRQGVEELNRDNPGVITNLAVKDGVILSGGSGIGDVAGPATSTTNKVPQWDTTNKKLKDGLTVGVAAGNLIVLDGTAKLPAVDGSQLINLPSGTGDVVGPAGATADAVAQFNTTTGKLIKSGPSIGTAANNLVQLNATAQIPAVDGSLLTGSVVKGPASVTADTLAQFDTTTGKLLKQGPALGTAANNVVQLDGTAKLPAVDGSQLTNLPSSGGLVRYSLDATAGKEVYVTASAAGVTGSWSGYTFTLTVPSGVVLNSLTVHNPASSGTFQNDISMGTYAGYNTSLIDRVIPVGGGVQTSTGSSIVVTVTASTTDMKLVTVGGLDDTLATMYTLSF